MSEELAFRKQAVEIRRTRNMMDNTRYNATCLTTDQRNQVSTIYGYLTRAAQELDALAEEIEEEKWGKDGKSKEQEKFCERCGALRPG